VLSGQRSAENAAAVLASVLDVLVADRR